MNLLSVGELSPPLDGDGGGRNDVIVDVYTGGGCSPVDPAENGMALSPPAENGVEFPTAHCALAGWHAGEASAMRIVALNVEES